MDEFSYGKLNILNSSTIIWTYVYSNQTLIDEIQFQKSHKIQVENVFNTRKEFIDSNESYLPINPVPSSISSYTAKSRQAKLIILFIFTVMSLFSIFFVFFFVRKRLRSREKKFFANYSNLVENEFDS